MADADLGALVVRMVVSLVVVLGIVLGAYALVRRRSQGRGFSVPATPGRRTRGAGRGAPKPALRVVARTGLGRNTGVAAVQFADRVLLLGSSEQGAPSLLAEMPLDVWTQLTAPAEELSPIDPAVDRRGGTLQRQGANPSLLDALREATTRRA
jgi:flagellar biogenesis protein FliO